MIKHSIYHYFEASAKDSPMQQQEIGKGTFGSVTLKLTADSATAVKTIPLKESYSHTMTLNEDSILSLCDHPHIVRYHSSRYCEASQNYYIEMEHLSGGNLHSVTLDNYAVLDEWLCQISSALVYLHERGLIHRDIKLQNIMLDKARRIKLIDFGVSVWKWMLPYEDNSFIGSPCYMAPQMVLRQHYDEKIDIYALGVSIYQLIHGHSPFKGSTKEEYWQNMINEKVRYAHHCPEKYRRLIKKMLQKDPTKRLSASQILDLLRRRPDEDRTLNISLV